jgi:hypothetical protein
MQAVAFFEPQAPGVSYNSFARRDRADCGKDRNQVGDIGGIDVYAPENTGRYCYFAVSADNAGSEISQQSGDNTIALPRI